MRYGITAFIFLCALTCSFGSAQAHGRHHYYRTAHHIVHHGSGNLVARSGATASVSEVARPHFQCLVDRLESAGYRIDFMGGYASRSNPSAHPTGNAVDINQVAFGRVTRALPFGYVGMAESCGVYSGSHFGDVGHFEMPGKYGYVNLGYARVRYAYRRHRVYTVRYVHRRRYAKG